MMSLFFGICLTAVLGVWLWLLKHQVAESDRKEPTTAAHLNAVGVSTAAGNIEKVEPQVQHAVGSRSRRRADGVQTWTIEG